MTCELTLSYAKSSNLYFELLEYKQVTIGAHLKTAQQLLNGIVFDGCEKHVSLTCKRLNIKI